MEGVKGVPIGRNGATQSSAMRRLCREGAKPKDAYKAIVAGRTSNVQVVVLSVILQSSQKSAMSRVRGRSVWKRAHGLVRLRTKRLNRIRQAITVRLAP